MDSPQPPQGPGAWPAPSGQPQGSPPPPPPPYGPPHPGGPGQPPHGGPPPWGQPTPPVSGLAVAALVTGLCGLFPVALALGLVALARISARRGAERGRGLAIAGVVLAGVQIAALAVIIPVAMTSDDDGDGAEATEQQRPERREPEDEPSDDPAPTDPAPEDGEQIDVFDIQVGDCFDSGTGLDGFDEGEGTEETTVTRLSCDAPHEAEAYGTTQVTGYDDFPGDAELARVAFDECGRLVQPYVLDTWELDTSTTMYFYYPQQSSWSFGDREILCFFGHTDGTPLDGSLRGDPGELSADQANYLEITTPLEIVIWNEPYPDEPLEDQRTWAEQMAETIDQEAGDLAAAEWSGDVAGQIDGLVTAREESITHWTAAADAQDMNEFDTQYTEGYGTLGVEQEIAIRQTLGLTTG